MTRKRPRPGRVFSARRSDFAAIGCLLVLCLSAGAARAQSRIAARMDPVVPVWRESEFTVLVELSGNQADVFRFALDFDYNSQALELVSVENVSGMPTFFVLPAVGEPPEDDGSNAHRRIVGADNGDLVDFSSGPLFRATFRQRAGVSYPLTIAARESRIGLSPLLEAGPGGFYPIPVVFDSSATRTIGVPPEGAVLIDPQASGGSGDLNGDGAIDVADLIFSLRP